MEDKKPLKRATELQPLSHDHHYALQLCWKIRTGFSKNIAVERIKLYTDWFFENSLAEHFKLEEQDVFTVLEPGNELVKRALLDHESLTTLFHAQLDVKENLEKIESLLKAHIRFEERELFAEVQKIATPQQLEKIEAAHAQDDFKEYDKDEFWL
ncbi:hemerythrin domain-containing protein [Flavobacterium sp. TAB 87]|uniref:hemerythrin domain-containing protein n=1 Tax=Flavobacterium sp. TAB 87 TaxID=1729581 RepID=UPI00076CABA5|nr:hemerythrin domain-containing protein [Flavobacterium sp. TAB 87]KVV14264.1 hypothetical protein AP058_02154 [Flavobacterium sp. TAB 87]